MKDTDRAGAGPGQLRLRVTKGPSLGSEFSFPPKVKVNIGRLVSGNKVSIKDAGISSKHLLIKFDTGLGYWTITDLNSSNGTIVNSKPLVPNTCCIVQDNDVIKFGEETVIEVAVEDDGGLGKENEENVGKPKRVTRRRACLGVMEEDGDLGVAEKIVENVAKPKRVTRRRAGLGGGKSGVVEEDGDLLLGVDKENEGKKGRGRVKKNESDGIGKEGELFEDLGEKNVEVVSTGLGKVTRSSRRKANDEGKDGGLGLGSGDELRGKMGRRRVQKNENSEIEKEKEKEGERLDDSGENEMKGMGVVLTGQRRVTRSTRRKGTDEGKNGEDVGDTGAGRVTRGGRVTRSSKIKAVSEIKVDDAAMGKEREKGPAQSQNRIKSTSVKDCGLGENGIEGGLVENSEVVDGKRNTNRSRVQKKLTLQSFDSRQINEEEMEEKSDLKEGGYELENQEGDQVEITQEKGCGDGLASAELRLSGGVNNWKIRQEEMAEKSKLEEKGDCSEVEKNGQGDRVESSQEKGTSDKLSVLGRLEKMTLGQWLDYIEEYLPKQIIAETEEMIMEMRRKAERFHEFMLEQNAAKERGEI